MTENEKEKKIIEKLMDIEDFHELKVRVSDTDLMDVVHSNIYINYLQIIIIFFCASSVSSQITPVLICRTKAHRKIISYIKR